MKGKLFLISVLVMLMFVAMVTPVLAAPKGQKVPASEESTSITYAGLTALTGEPNPYPAPPVTERYYNPGHVLNPVPTPTDFTTMQAHSSSYYIITDLTIGDDHFTGVSCNVQNAELNFKTHNMNIQYDAIWYIDELGDLSCGFAGNIEAKIFNYVGGVYDRITVHLVMKGFGDFDGQTLMLSFDSDVDVGPWHGYCLKA